MGFTREILSRGAPTREIGVSVVLFYLTVQVSREVESLEKCVNCRYIRELSSRAR